MKRIIRPLRRDKVCLASYFSEDRDVRQPTSSTSHAQYDQRTKTRGFLDVAPELVVEILWPERPDTDQKVIEYLAIGVRLVLVVDPSARTISLHQPNDGIRLYTEPDLEPCDDALPGFRLRVAEVFEM